MNTMEITKFVGAICGSLLIFLLIQTAGEAIYHDELEEAAYSIEVEEPEAAEGEGEGEEAPAEEAVDVAALVEAADPAGGESIFRRCASCHNLEGGNGVGPYLNGVVGRDIASIEDYSYSDVLAEKEGAWTPEELYAFIDEPAEYAEGTKMSFAGLDDPEDLANVVAYLSSVTN